MFTECITVRIVRGSERLFYAVHFAECLDDVRIEASDLGRYGFVKELNIHGTIFRQGFLLLFLLFD